MNEKWHWKAWSILLYLVLAIWIEPSYAVYNVGTIKCTDTLEHLDVQNTKEVTVECPMACLDGYCKVIGSGPYTDTSRVCCAAIHNGTLVSSEGGKIILVISHSLVPHFIGSTRNGIKSKNEFQQSTVTFITKKIPRESSSTSLKTTTLSTNITATSSVSSAVVKFPSSTASERPYSSTASERPYSSTASERPYSSTEHQAEVDEAEVDYAALHEEKEADINEDSEYEETTKDLTTTSVQRAISRPTGMVSHAKTQNQLKIATTTELPEAASFLDLHYHFLIIGIILAFIGGVFFGLVFMCLRKRVKKHRRDRPRKCTSGSKKKDSRATNEEGDICVCYQKLSSSKEGLLLYDPETCDRPCPIRQPYEDNALMSDVSMTKSFASEEPVNHEGRIKRESKCKIRYEGECSSACNGACNPERFDF